MNVYRLHGPKDLRLESEALPPCGLGQLVAETKYSMISPGTELAAYNGSLPLRNVSPYPRLLGYCNLAVVTESRCKIPIGQAILTHQSHRSAFCVSESDVLATCQVNPGYAATYLYVLAARALNYIREPIAVIGLGALGYAVADLARLRGIDCVVVTDQDGESWMRSVKRANAFPVKHVVLTSNTWKDYELATTIAQESIALLGFPGRGQAVERNPLALLYPKGLTLRQIGEVPDTVVKAEMVSMALRMKLMRTDPLTKLIPHTELKAFYETARAPGEYSAVLEW